MSSRRELIGGVAALLVATTMGLTAAFGQGRDSGLPTGIGVEPDYDGPLPKMRRGGTLGDRPPLNRKERIAKSIISRAPVGPSPFAVAKFFAAIAKGEYGKEWQPYAQGWPIRWNPIIVNFFQATKTKPEGDLTPWCAAFVNWCFARAGKGAATESASSGSFRTFGVATNSPAPGDIVVFRRTSPDGDAGMQGHVGFYVGATDDQIEVLGGNQIEGSQNSHRVSSKLLKRSGTKLVFHSYRTDGRLH